MNPLASPPELTPLEQEVLEEYERLAENMKKVSPIKGHRKRENALIRENIKKNSSPSY